MLLANNGPRIIFMRLNCQRYLIESAWHIYTVYPKKYAHGFCFAVLCCGYTLTEFPISIRLTSLALWQSNDCPKMPAKQPWWIWINTSCEFIMNDNITTTKQSTTKPCAYFLGYTVWWLGACLSPCHYLNHCWSIINLRPVSFIQNLKHFVKENAFENVVCKMAVILS